jgi:hypothetical protein
MAATDKHETIEELLEVTLFRVVRAETIYNKDEQKFKPLIFSVPGFLSNTTYIWIYMV